jgi:hypothetical protein
MVRRFHLTTHVLKKTRPVFSFFFNGDFSWISSQWISPLCIHIVSPLNLETSSIVQFKEAAVCVFTDFRRKQGSFPKMY